MAHRLQKQSDPLDRQRRHHPLPVRSQESRFPSLDQKEFTDFTLTLEFKNGEGTIDSGVMLKRAKDQIQIGISGSLKRDLTASPYIPGKGYPVEGKEAIAAVKPKDWNKLKIEVKGSTYKTWLNGVEGITYTSETAIPKGPLGLQLHGNRDMSISFRNIEITEK